MQTINGRFVMKLIGIPLLIFVGQIVCESEKGNEAVGRALFIGPFMIGIAGPRFRRKP
jgi:hypothetical protein